MLLGRTITALFFIAAAHAQPAGPKLTTIQDTLYRADGTRLTGTVTVSWAPFDANDTSVIGKQTITVPVNNGALYVQLVPTTDATPAGAYTVLYQSDGREQFAEQWAVPPATKPLRVRDVRTVLTASTSGGGTTGGTGGGTGGGVSPTQPITEDSVVGLTADLSVRPVKGPGYTNGRTALVNEIGGIETVAGNLSDCVHVDGTSGACFDATLLPSFSDAETPGGVVDGANSTFTLAAVPSPAASLLLFRNGMAMNPGSDYAASGSSVTFVAAAIPQPGDTLVAWYRAASAGSLAGGLRGGGSGGTAGGLTAFSPATPQVMCSAEGSSTTAITPISLGYCMIPAGILQAGDRVEVRATVIHQGGATPSTIQLNWGGAVLVTHLIAATDSVFALKGDASLSTSSTIWTGQTYGQTTTPASAIGVSAASVGTRDARRFPVEPWQSGHDGFGQSR